MSSVSSPSASHCARHSLAIGLLSTLFLLAAIVPRGDTGLFATACILVATFIAVLSIISRFAFRKDARRSLENANQRLQIISDSALDAVVMADSSGTIVHWNPAAERMFGYTADEATGRNVHELLALPAQRREADAAFERFSTTGHGNAVGRVLQLETARRDGSVFPIEIALSSVFSEGQWWAVAFLRDITERREAERKIAASQEALRSIVEHLPVGVVLVDRQRRIRQVNKAAREMSGFACSEELQGQTCHGRLCPAREGQCPVLDLGQKVEQAEMTLVTKDAREIPILKTVLPITLNGEPMLLGSFIDISTQKQAERQLRETAAVLFEARRAADEANRAKSEFLANMSHEIRTPLTAILGYCDVLLSDPPDVSFPDTLQTIRRNGEHLLDLINDILDLSKLEAGEIEFFRAPCSPLQIARDVVDLLRVRATSKGLSLDIECQGPVPETIETDPARLRRILVSLVGNAIKFTSEGGVRIILRTEASSSRDARLVMDVIDTGIGIPACRTGRLFSPFNQADASTTRRFGGTGLGLAISKRLAQTLGGDITFDSVEGQGSSFHLTIGLDTWEEDASPVVTPSVSVLSPDPTPSPNGSPIRLKARILLAEDGLDNQRLLSLILRRAGADVEVAADGESAVEMTLAAEKSGHPFHLILMDMQMPIVDGYEATRRLRELGFANPIVAITAHAMVGDDRRCLDAGCDAYLTKPVRHDEFLAAVARCLGQTPYMACDA